ncbi:uncharacterized protein [Gossypium hirsutum]|nr:uncharacterized protein LOC121223186 [Gossypium hirsutum]
MIVIKQERKLYIIEEPIPNEPTANISRTDKDAYKKYLDDMLDIGYVMLAIMTPELQKQHEDMVVYDMIQHLKELYEGQACQERYETSKVLFRCKMVEGTLVGTHVLKMIGYIESLEKLGFPLGVKLATDVILQSFYMKKVEPKTIMMVCKDKDKGKLNDKILVGVLIFAPLYRDYKGVGFWLKEMWTCELEIEQELLH